MSDRFFSRQARLRSSDDFRRVYRRRRSAADDVLLVYGCENNLPYARLGLSVSRKVGNAVCRNRWKRLIREAFRLQRDRLPTGVDWIVIPRADTVPSLDRLANSLVQLTQRIGGRLHRSGKPTAEGSR